MTPAPTCPSCLFWKRRTPIAGTCWHPRRDAVLVHDDSRCEDHQRRTVRQDRREER